MSVSPPSTSDAGSRLQAGAQQAAAQFARMAGRATFGPDTPALQFLDQLVERQRPSLRANAEAARSLTQALGCFIGQCLVDLYRGRWVGDTGYPVDMPRPDGGRQREYPFQFASELVAGRATVTLLDYVLTLVPQRLSAPLVVASPAGQPAVLRAVQNFATQVLEELGRASRADGFGYNAESIAFLDNHIDDQTRRLTSPDQRKLLVNRLGAFLGQAVVEVFAGEWTVDEDGRPVVRVVRPEKEHVVDPFAKISRRMDNGLADNLQGWFTRLLPLALGVPPPPASRRQAAAVATSDVPAAQEEELRALAARVLNDLDLADFGYTAAAVACVEQHLEDVLPQTGTAHGQARLVREMGTFVGECVQRVYGGRWQCKADGTPCVVLSVDGQKVVLDPLGMVERRIRQGAQASLEEWFARTLPLVALPAAARLVDLRPEKTPGITRRFLDSFLFRG